MTTILPSHRPSACVTHLTMRGIVISLSLIFAILLGATHASAVAHPHEGDIAEVVDMFDDDHHAIDMSDDSDDAAPEGKSDMAQHHHCSVSLPYVGPGLCDRAVPDGVKPVQALASTLVSITGAPLIEPPSA